MAKKKKVDIEEELSSEDMAEIEEMTENLGPKVDIPEELQEEIAEASGETTSLAADLEAARDEARNNQDQYLRTLADMDNLRKRTQREKEDIAKFGNENILREILPVIDNLERAIEHAKSQDEGGGLLEGVEMTLSQFSSVLQKFGVEALTSTGEPFDPAHHQAMGQLETEEVPANHVANELQKGYMLNNRLLRPAMVMVAKPPQATVENEETPTPSEDSGE